MRRPIKVKYYILAVAAILLTVTLALFSILSSRYSKRIDDQIASEVSSTLKVYLSSVRDQFKNADKFLYADFPALRQEIRDPAEGEELLRSECRKFFDGNQAISCFIFSSTDSEMREYIAADSGSYTTEGVERILESAIRRSEAALGGGMGWSAVEVDGRCYLEQSVTADGIICVCAVDLENLGQQALSRYNMRNAVVFLKNGEPLNRTYWLRGYTGQDAVEREDYYVLDNGDTRLIAVTGQLLDMTVVYASQTKVGSYVMMTLAAFALAIGLSFLLCGAAIYVTVLHPLKELENVMARIRDGDLEARPRNFRNAELNQVNETFNQMIASITKLKIEKYEQQMLSAKLEMDALRLQIRPHFYLNCMKNLYGLSQMGRYDQLQESIICLSNHLRFTFDLKRSAVTLREELTMCENYVTLQGIGQELKPELRMSVDSSLMELTVPPVSLLTLTENCFKHAAGNDRPVIITVTVRQYAVDRDRVVSIRLADNGPGFDRELLGKLNRDVDAINSAGTGLRNVVRRFQLMYGEDFSIVFLNSQGAAIEITIQQRGENDEASDR